MPSRATTRAKNHKPNAWVQHVQRYRSAHGCSYRDALKGARATYRGMKQLYRCGEGLYSAEVRGDAKTWEQLIVSNKKILHKFAYPQMSESELKTCKLLYPNYAEEWPLDEVEVGLLPGVLLP